jgi:hypothetical protein
MKSRRFVKSEHPLVFQQEYEAEWVDWSGVAFFALESLLIDGKPVQSPPMCEAVYAVIDTAVKTGSDNDGTAVIYYAFNNHFEGPRLVILDYDIIQIEGSLLEAWLPTVFQNLESLAKQTRARAGAIGCWIEDKASGMVLLQQAARRGWRAHPIDTALTAHGKDETGA